MKLSLVIWLVINKWQNRCSYTVVVQYSSIWDANKFFISHSCTFMLNKIFLKLQKAGFTDFTICLVSRFSNQTFQWKLSIQSGNLVRLNNLVARLADRQLRGGENVIKRNFVEIKISQKNTLSSGLQSLSSTKLPSIFSHHRKDGLEGGFVMG